MTLGKTSNINMNATKKETTWKKTYERYQTCGTDDRGTAMEFKHLDIVAFNRACDKFLQERDPEYQKRIEFWAKDKKKMPEKHFDNSHILE